MHPLQSPPSLMIERNTHQGGSSGKKNDVTTTSWCLNDSVEGDVQPGSLLGPITGLGFSRDGGLLFSCSGSCLAVFDVRSGALLYTARVFPPGLVVYGLDVGHKSLGAVFGDRCVCVVSGVPSAASLDAVSSARRRWRRDHFPTVDGDSDGDDDRCAWFRSVARLPRLRDRVWDARLIESKTEFQREEGMDEGGGGFNGEDMKRFLGGDRDFGYTEQGLVAIALAHNTVEVWDWTAPRHPARVFSACGGDPCLVYHACLWGRTLGDLRVACGTAFNKVLVWSPGRGPGGSQMRPESGVLRLEGHEGVIFRVSWRDDGKRLASVSDDRTVRVWDVDRGCFPPSPASATADTGTNAAAVEEGSRSPEGRLVATGWGHASRVWDVAFTDVGLVTAGEDGTVILWRETEPCHSTFPTKDLDRDSDVDSCADVGARERLLALKSTLRGHSGSHVWRLAVHHERARTAENDACGGCRKGGRVKYGGGMVLLATGGNDGGCKLWDLVFEAARERRPGTLWGETDEIPSLQHFLHLGPVTAVAVTAKTKSSRDSPPSVLLPPIPSTAHEKIRSHRDAPPTEERHPLVGKTSPPSLDLNWNSRARRRDVRRAQGRTVTESRRRTKPSVVREIRVCREGLRAATVLLSDGSVWWVPDLSVGPWEPIVMVPSFHPSQRVSRLRDVAQAGIEESSPSVSFQGAKMAAAGREAVDRHNKGGTNMEIQGDRSGGGSMASCLAGDISLSAAGVSAMAILVRPRRHLDAGYGSKSVIGGARGNDGSRDNASPPSPPAFSSCSLPTATDARPDHGRRGERRGPVHAIVVGRDDGWMSLLVSPGVELPASTPRNPTCFPRPSSSSQTSQDARAGSEEDGEGEGVATADTDVGSKVSRDFGSGIGRSSRPWRVVASWKGHKCRVTSLWVVQNGDETFHTSSVVENASSRGGNPLGGTVEELNAERSVPPFMAALNTSRLSIKLLDADSDDCDGCFAVSAMFDGALVSAGSDGTVAWWEWPDFVERGGVSVFKDGGDCMPAPKLRMVCHAGSVPAAAAITSVVIDDRRRIDHCSYNQRRQQLPDGSRDDYPRRMLGKNVGNRETREAKATFSGGTPLPPWAPLALSGKQRVRPGSPSPTLCLRGKGTASAAVVFCGDTKGNIRCFLEKGEEESEDVMSAGLGDSTRYSSPKRSGSGDSGVGRSCMDKGVSPCVVLKRQHGKDQVSRLALLGDCLFSAGHNGNVNQYVISYPPYRPRPRRQTASSCGLETRQTLPEQNDDKDADGSDAPRDTGQPPVVLTLVTCYAAAPITAISDLWVGGGAGGRLGRDSNSSPFRLAVAGRSGASRMSLWDLTEGRQLLELDCGDRHLAQDLAVLWRPAGNPHRLDPCSSCTATAASSPPAQISPSANHCSCCCRYSCLCSSSSSSHFKSSTRIAGTRPGGIPLPFHTYAVAARPEPTAVTKTAPEITQTSRVMAHEGKSERDKAVPFAPIFLAPLMDRVGGTAAVVVEEKCRGGSRRSNAGADRVDKGDKEARGYAFEMGPQQKKHLQQRQEGSAGKTISDVDSDVVEGRGVLIRFHSTVARGDADVVDWKRSRSVDAAAAMVGWEWSQQQQYPHRGRVELKEECTGASIDHQTTDRQATDRQIIDLKTGTDGEPSQDKITTAQRYELPIAERLNTEAEGLTGKIHGKINRKPYEEASLTEAAALPEGSAAAAAAVKTVRDSGSMMASSCASDEDRQAASMGWGGKGSIQRRLVGPPRKFSYSLVAPFHCQRVTCVKFLVPPAPAPRSGFAKERCDGDDKLPGLHLVTGGEDGVVRILDTSGWLSGRSTRDVTVENSDGDALRVPSGSPPARPPASPKSFRPNDVGVGDSKTGPPSSAQAFLQPAVATAAVVQVLPSHESSVGAVAAIETPEGVYGEPRGQILIASGGGKMELRTWCLGGRAGNSGSEEVGKGSREAGDAVPPVRWLVTTTPEPTSSLHAHRIMCLCVLPPLPPLTEASTRTGSRASETTTGTASLIISGDSGGGVTMFEMRRNRDPSTATTAFIPNCSPFSSSPEHAASRPIGRWLVTGERPVLCVAHVRVVSVAGERWRQPAPKPKPPNSPKVPAFSAGECDPTLTSEPHHPTGSTIEGRFGEVTEEASFGCEGTRSGRTPFGFVAAGASGLTDELLQPEDGSKAAGTAGKGLVCESSPVSPLVGTRFSKSAESDLRHDRGSEMFSREEGAVIDFIVTGDTAGTVTVWELLYGGGDEKGSPGGNRPPPPPPQADDVIGRFVHLGPEGKRRGNPRFDEASMPPARLVPVLQYCAHQMGVLCVATHAFDDGPRFLIVTGGDDQALCVAEVDASSPTKAAARGQSAVSLVAGGEPVRMEGAAGSAIKGVAMLPATRRGPAEPRVAQGVRNGQPLPGAALSVFTVARDQRLSRWDLVEECLQQPPPPPQQQQQQRRKGGTKPGIMEGDQEASVCTDLETSVWSEDCRRSSCSSGGGENDSATDGFSDGSAAVVTAATTVRSREAGRSEKEGRRRWRFIWRAGCVTDVCDVSGLDAVALPPLGCPSSTVSREMEETRKEETQGGQNDFPEALLASPAALVAVSGQGLQLVRFGVTRVIHSRISKG